jgi:glucose/arabinose dehydrogenase
VVLFSYAAGASRITAAGRKLTAFKRGGHWTRSLLPSPDGRKLFVGVGSLSNIGDEGMAAEEAGLFDPSARGGFYGCPYCYWGQTVDDWVKQDPAMVAKSITPDYAPGGRTASLGLCWVPAGMLTGFLDGMAIGQHGSWNRSTLSGYKVVFVPFENGRPVGPPRDILSGFLAPDEGMSRGRPVGVRIASERSVLMADDVGDLIWHVTGERQG